MRSRCSTARSQPDRPAPVVHDDRRAAQVEVLEQRRRQLAVAVVGVPADVGRLVRASEAGQVGRDAAKAGVAHGRDHLAPQERPGRLAVEEDHGRALALVEVGEAQPVDLAVVRVEREVREPLQRLLGRAHRVGSSRLAAYPRAPSARLAPDAQPGASAAPVLAAEKSKVPFYIAGGLLVAWALTVSLGIGMRRPDFPSTTAVSARSSRSPPCSCWRGRRPPCITSGSPAKTEPVCADAEHPAQPRRSPVVGRPCRPPRPPPAAGTPTATTGTPAPPSSPRRAKPPAPWRSPANPAASSLQHQAAEREGGHGDDHDDEHVAGRTQRDDRAGQQGPRRDADLRRRDAALTLTAEARQVHVLLLGPRPPPGGHGRHAERLVKLYVCWGTFPTPRPGGHPCANAYHALRDAGHDPEVVKSYGFAPLPGALNQTRGRREVQELTGNRWVPDARPRRRLGDRRLACDRRLGPGEPGVALAVAGDRSRLSASPRELVGLVVRDRGARRERPPRTAPNAITTSPAATMMVTKPHPLCSSPDQLPLQTRTPTGQRSRGRSGETPLTP